MLEQRIYSYKPDRNIVLSIVSSIVVSVIFYIILTTLRSRHDIEDLASFVKLFYTFGLIMCIFLYSLKVLYNTKKRLYVQRDRLIYTYGVFFRKVDVIQMSQVVSCAEIISPTQAFFGSSTLVIKLIYDDDYVDTLKFADIEYGYDATDFIGNLMS